jgi:hypothetical protein
MFVVAEEARLALAPFFDRGALVSVEARSAGHFAGDRLVPHLAIVSREEVTPALEAEIKRALDKAGVKSPFLVSRAAPWTAKRAGER